MEESSYYLTLKRKKQNPCIPLNLFCLSCSYYRDIGVGYCIVGSSAEKICIYNPLNLYSMNDNNNP